MESVTSRHGAKLGERLERKYSPAAAELRHLALPAPPALPASFELCMLSVCCSLRDTTSSPPIAFFTPPRAVFDVRVAN
jgi:hypothetical protein